MADFTPNLNLVKPSYDDNVDIQQINGNMDILDTALSNEFQSINNTIGTSNDTGSQTGTTLFSLIKWIVGKFTSIWTDARAAKLDKIDTIQTNVGTINSNANASRMAKIDTMAADISTIKNNSSSSNEIRSVSSQVGSYFSSGTSDFTRTLNVPFTMSVPFEPLGFVYDGLETNYPENSNKHIITPLLPKTKAELPVVTGNSCSVPIVLDFHGSHLETVIVKATMYYRL